MGYGICSSSDILLFSYNKDLPYFAPKCEFNIFNCGSPSKSGQGPGATIRDNAVPVYRIRSYFAAKIEFSSQGKSPGIYIRLEKLGNFTRNSGKVRKFYNWNHWINILKILHNKDVYRLHVKEYFPLPEKKYWKSQGSLSEKVGTLWRGAMIRK